ncbi:hypothetical protein LINPERPRIM_LOCUS18353, partial [Linum perenne]
MHHVSNVKIPDVLENIIRPRCRINPKRVERGKLCCNSPNSAAQVVGQCTRETRRFLLCHMP